MADTIPELSTHHRRYVHWAKQALAFGAYVLGAGVLVLWSWNTAVTEVFAAPRLEYKHALSLVILAALAGVALRGVRRRPPAPRGERAGK